MLPGGRRLPKKRPPPPLLKLRRPVLLRVWGSSSSVQTPTLAPPTETLNSLFSLTIYNAAAGRICLATKSGSINGGGCGV